VYFVAGLLERRGGSMRKLFMAVLVAALVAIGAGSALAASTGTGQPSQTCLSTTAPAEPGQAALAPGSAFNEPTATTPGGTAGAVYAGNGVSKTKAGSPNAVSQYDVACYQVSQGH